MSRPDDFAPVAAAHRCGFVESVHFGAVVVLAADGTIDYQLGNPHAEIYGRSCNKPLQAAAMLDAGLVLAPEQLAVACASHSGAPMHLDMVRSILDDAGLDESALQNTPTLPYDRVEAEAVLAGGGHPTALAQNCSGKHAAMLATCRANDWSIDDYLNPEHPLQQAVTTGVADRTGGVVHVGIDGCGAPTHATTLAGLAQAFAGLAVADGAVYRAMTNHPYLVGGTGRVVTDLMVDVPGLMAKDGADGVFAAALPDGRAAAIKIADGASRAIGVVMARALQLSGQLNEADPSRYGDPIKGHGGQVGELLALF